MWTYPRASVTSTPIFSISISSLEDRRKGSGSGLHSADYGDLWSHEHVQYVSTKPATVFSYKRNSDTVKLLWMPTLLVAMSLTDRWVWIVSSCSRHQSNSPRVVAASLSKSSSSFTQHTHTGTYRIHAHYAKAGRWWTENSAAKDDWKKTDKSKSNRNLKCSC